MATLCVTWCRTASSVSKVLVPLGPLFACAVMLQAVNVMLGSPVSFDYSPPPVASLDAGGVKAFLMGMLPLVSGLIQQGLVADWGSLSFYVLLGFVLSLSLGACVSFEKFREAGSFAAAREHGWLRLEGKEYVVNDGEVIHFRFNV